MFEDDSGIEGEASQNLRDGLEHVYSDGFLIDLTPSPLREVCFEGSIGQSRGRSTWNGFCRFCADPNRGEVSIGAPQVVGARECSPSGGSFWCGALGPTESSFLGNVHQQCRATCTTCIGGGQEFLTELGHDYQGFYSPRGLAIVGIQVGVAAVLANTSMDQNFQSWHDDNIRSSGSDDLADAVSWLGDGTIMIPVFAGATLLECFARNDQPVLKGIGNWGSRCSRSVLVGGPMVLGLQYVLGGSRPIDGRGSSWKLFGDNNSVSGHAFIGATSFLNAAMMTENIPLKVTLYGLSTLPAWSRVNDQRHYLSQVLLGWGIAWLAADVVDRTERSQRNWIIVPCAIEGGLGIQSIFAY